jgi:hypothetical protein
VKQKAEDWGRRKTLWINQSGATLRPCSNDSSSFRFAKDSSRS